MWNREGELKGNTSGEEQVRWVVFRASALMPWQCGEGVGRDHHMFWFPCVVMCFPLKNTDSHTCTTPSCSLNHHLLFSLMSTWEGRKGEMVMEGEKDLLVGRQQRWDTAKREGGVGEGGEEERRPGEKTNDRWSCKWSFLHRLIAAPLLFARP